MADYAAMAAIDLTNPDRRADNTGLDDGPELPMKARHLDKKRQAIEMRKMGLSVRHIGGALSVSHDTAHKWTRHTPKGPPQ